MTPKQIDKFCSALPAATRTVQWEGVVVFKVGGKMFCLDRAARPLGGPHLLSKCPPEHYEALSHARGCRIRTSGTRRSGWRSTIRWILTPAETRAYVKRAHAVIAAALPKKKQAALGL